MKKRSVELAPGEEFRLRAAVTMEIYDLARRDGLTGAQFRDVVDRLVQGPGLFLTEDYRLEGGPADLMYGDLKADAANAHLFTVAAEEKPKGESRFGGMTEAEFMTLPAKRRLEIANEAAAKGQ